MVERRARNRNDQGLDQEPAWHAPVNHIGDSRLASEDSVKIITNIEAFKALQDDSDDLCTRSNYRFTQRFAWCWTSWEVMHRRRNPRLHLHCIATHDRTRLVLIWPFVVYRRPHGYFAMPLACVYGQSPDPLVENGPEANRRIEAAWRTLRNTCRCDLIRLRYVLEGSELHRLMVRERAKAVSKTINLSVEWRDHDNWESYYRGLEGHDRRDTERCHRRLGEVGKVSFEAIDGPQCTPAIDWALARKNEQWDRNNPRGGGWIRIKAFRDLMVCAALRGIPRGRVIVFALKLDDHIIATLLCYVDDICLEGISTVYDPAYSLYAPGKILQLKCLKWAFEHGLEFDFGNGDQPHKRRWANRERSAITYEVPNSMSHAIGSWFPVLTPVINTYRLARQQIGQKLRLRSRSEGKNRLNASQ